MDNSIYKGFAKRFLPIALILVVAALLLTNYQAAVLKNEISAREKSAVLMGKEVIQAALTSHISDALFLAKSAQSKLDRYIDKVALREELAREYKTFSAVRGVYDQIRFLDYSGMEFVRVNLTKRGPWTVPLEEMQDKGSRYYFKKGLRSKEEVYISRFDLNKEHGEIEIPLKPMLRFSTPVFDDGSQIRGVIVLNYLGINLLDRIRGISKESDGTIFFVNPNGYWLIGPRPADEWGFMYEEGKSNTMASMYPQEWERLSSFKKGQFSNKNGMFTFVTVSALGSGPQNTAKRLAGEVDEEWKIVSIVSPTKLISPWKYTVYGGCFVLLLALGGIVWFWSQTKVRELENVLALAESENMFRSVTDAIRDAIIMVDSSGKTSFWNPAAKEIFGYEAKEVMGRTLHPLITPQRFQNDNQIGLDSFKATDQGKVFSEILEVPALRRDGTEFIAELNANLLQIKGQRFAVGIIRDITDRKLIEEEIRKMNEELETRVQQRTAELESKNRELQEREVDLRKLTRAIEHSPVSVVITDLEGHVEYVNPSYYAVTGYGYEEVRGEILDALKPGGKSDVFYKEIWDTILSGRVWSGELESRRKNGDFFWESTSISPIRDEEGVITHFVAVNDDITDHKEADKALEMAEEQNRLVLSSVGEGIIGVNTEGKITFVNPSAEEILGFGSNELIGYSIHNKIQHSRADGTAYESENSPIRDTYTKGQSHFVTDEVFWRKDSSHFFADYKSTPIQKDQKIIGAVVTFSDVTKRKQMEDELIQHVEGLERFSNLAVGREMTMIDLKKEVNRMCHELGQDPKYTIVSEDNV